MADQNAEQAGLNLGERTADCGCCTVVDSVALGQIKHALVSVQAALDYDGDPRGVSCGGLDIYASGCFAGDLARRVKAALPTPPQPAAAVPTFRRTTMPEPQAELVRALRALADQIESWEWHAPVGPGNASYANGYENGRRAAGADLRALLAAYPTTGDVDV